MICAACKSENDDDAVACFNCGQAQTRESQTIQRGSLIDERYEIVSRVGKGGMGTVYKAIDRKLEEEVAIKVLRDEVAQGEEAERRFRHEIKLARKVTHKNVCRIHEYGEDGSLRYISMELIEGIDLKQFLKTRGVPPAGQAFEIAFQVADGLQAIHDVGIIHRDLKTPNLMLDASGVVRLMDFGIAKKTGVEATAATATGMVVGTPDYMSPEQARGLKVDSRSDVYALGIVIFELFTGTLPFAADTAVATILKHISEAPPLDGQAAAGIPDTVRTVLRKALAKDPEERYASVREMRAALVEAQATASAGAAGFSSAPHEAIDATVTLPATSRMDVVLPTVALPTPMPSATLAPAAGAAAPSAPRPFFFPALAAGAVALGVGLWIWSRAPEPAPSPQPTAVAAAAAVQVTLNALPWARVKLSAADSSLVPALTNEESATPLTLRLLPAEYTVELENGGITPPLRETIRVRAGQANDFRFSMPSFDPQAAAERAQARGTR